MASSWQKSQLISDGRWNLVAVQMRNANKVVGSLVFEVKAMKTFRQDLRYAERQLWKHPAFTVTAVLTLALGIGANTAIFTVVQSILLAPLPYVDANRIMALDTHWMNTGRMHSRVTGPDAVDVRNQ